MLAIFIILLRSMFGGYWKTVTTLLKTGNIPSIILTLISASAGLTFPMLLLGSPVFLLSVRHSCLQVHVPSGLRFSNCRVAVHVVCILVLLVLFRTSVARPFTSSSSCSLLAPRLPRQCSSILHLAAHQRIHAAWSSYFFSLSSHSIGGFLFFKNAFCHTNRKKSDSRHLYNLSTKSHRRWGSKVRILLPIVLQFCHNLCRIRIFHTAYTLKLKGTIG